MDLGSIPEPKIKARVNSDFKMNQALLFDGVEEAAVRRLEDGVEVLAEELPGVLALVPGGVVYNRRAHSPY